MFFTDILNFKYQKSNYLTKWTGKSNRTQFLVSARPPGTFARFSGRGYENDWVYGGYFGKCGTILENYIKFFFLNRPGN